MSGETELHPSAWTPDLLYLHLKTRLEDRDRLVQAKFDAISLSMSTALAAAREADDKASTANERRFDSVNEFRGQLNDVMSMMMPRAEADARFVALSEKLDAMQRTVDRSTSGYDATRSTTHQNWGYFIGAAGVMFSIVTIIVMVLG